MTKNLKCVAKANHTLADVNAKMSKGKSYPLRCVGGENITESNRREYREYKVETHNLQKNAYIDQGLKTLSYVRMRTFPWTMAVLTCTIKLGSISLCPFYLHAK